MRSLEHLDSGPCHAMSSTDRKTERQLGEYKITERRQASRQQC